MSIQGFKEYVKEHTVEIVILSLVVIITAVCVGLIGTLISNSKSKSEPVTSVTASPVDSCATDTANAPEMAEKTAKNTMVIAVFWSDSHIDTMTIQSNRSIEYRSIKGSNLVRDSKKCYIYTTAPIKILSNSQE